MQPAGVPAPSHWWVGFSSGTHPLSTHTTEPFPQAPRALQRGTHAPSTQTASFAAQSLVMVHALAGRMLVHLAPGEDEFITQPEVLAQQLLQRQDRPSIVGLRSHGPWKSTASGTCSAVGITVSSPARIDLAHSFVRTKSRSGMRRMIAMMSRQYPGV